MTAARNLPLHLTAVARGLSEFGVSPAAPAGERVR